MTEPNDSHESTSLSRDSETQDVSRRDWAKVLGALVGVGTLSACAGQPSDTSESEPMGSASEAVIGGNVVVYTSVSQLKNGPAGSGVQTAITLGYASEGDGGGGVWAWNPIDSSPQTNDPQFGILVVPFSNPSTGRWKRIYSGPLDIRWFGAKISSSDNSSAIAGALAAGSHVYIPEGVFRFTQQLDLTPASVTDMALGRQLTGSGWRSILLYQGNGGTALTLTCPDITNSHSVFADFRLQAYPETGTVRCVVGLRITNNYATSIRNVYFWGIDPRIVPPPDGGAGPDNKAGFTEAALKIDATFGNTSVINVTGCVIQGSLGDGICVVGRLPAAINVTSCLIHQNAGVGVHFPKSASSASYFPQISINSSVLEGNHLGQVVLDGSQQVAIDNCYFECAETTAIQIGTTQASSGIVSQCLGVSITSNWFGGFPAYFVDLAQVAPGSSGHVLITGNRFTAPSDSNSPRLTAAVRLFDHKNVVVLANLLENSTNLVETNQATSVLVQSDSSLTYNAELKTSVMRAFSPAPGSAGEFWLDWQTTAVPTFRVATNSGQSFVCSNLFYDTAVNSQRLARAGSAAAINFDNTSGHVSFFGTPVAGAANQKVSDGTGGSLPFNELMQLHEPVNEREVAFMVRRRLNGNVAIVPVKLGPVIVDGTSRYRALVVDDNG